MKMTVAHASMLLCHLDGFQWAILDEDEAQALEVIHSAVRNYTRIDSATLGFTAGLHYGKRQEREHRRMVAQRKAR